MKLFSRALHSAALKWTMGSLGLALAGLSLGTAGCTTDAYCFSCNDNTGGSGSSTTTGTNTGGATGTGGFNPTGGTGGDCFPNCTTSSSGSGCMQTNGGVEICDGLDNDCNGTIDDGFDFSNPKSCGTCDHNCYAILLNNDPLTITCTPSANPGKDPGTCKGTCSQDYFDLDKDGTCEYYCIKDANNDTLCDNKDNDCDGLKDEDVNRCTDTANCGQCGRNCTAPHAMTACVNSGGANCTAANTQCQIQQCVCTGPGDCWWDLDKSYATGCEYQCDQTNGGVEICGDSIDNDCDGKIDEADDLTNDPNIGVTCYGDPDGECATMAHAGITQCIGNKVVCTGMNVLVENQKLETCDGVDNDCDGVVDDNPTDAGSSCGMSNIFPCSLGTLQCQSGQLVCVGAIDPAPETCDGTDNDCNGTIDDNLASMACDVPPPPPMGATSPCKAGVTQCVAGGVQCVGSIKPVTQNDTCGVDANCDGTLTNQPDLQTDINNCGACGNSCIAGAVHANWACEMGACVFKGCQTGYVDLDNDKKCEYACTYISSQESCNGIDDNCNGQVDEGVMAPSPVQVCGVSPSATRPECTTGVTVACQNGSWSCSFPAGVCNAPGGCSATTEICDTLDNNCNGFLNETTPNYGKPCASDDGKPPPGDGACRTTGTYVCSGASSTVCSALKANCSTLPGGCTEVCDGVDNDCDGLIDEPYTNKGSNSANFVKPAVTKVGSSPNLWIMSYEASRPSATTTSAGSGNGYWTSAPAGKTLDKTPACSVPTKIPWFNVTPQEAEQTCAAIGGKLCSTAEWQSTCTATASCKWGYAPRGGACTSSYTSTKLCNLGLSFDFDQNSSNGNQNGLLVTGAAATNVLKSCWSDWSLLQGNSAANERVYDVTGNLREITKGTAANTYPLMGGSFNSSSEDGAACGFSFYTVDQNFQLFDLGYRCCFSADPTL